MMSASSCVHSICAALHDLADPASAVTLQRFFKTGPGQYAEGDRFLGVRVPRLRQLVKRFNPVPLDDATSLLDSPWHEERLLGLLFLIDLFEHGSEAQKKTIVTRYLNHSFRVNNWDLVDLSAPAISGAYFFARSRKPLFSLARSSNLWERRIAIVSTLFWIRHNDLQGTLGIAELLLADSEDLIHKATGWMLREIGKRDQHQLESFLKQHYYSLPRTTLRYAIERFPEPLRQAYLSGAFTAHR